jgi:hypothetical protein
LVTASVLFADEPVGRDRTPPPAALDVGYSMLLIISVLSLVAYNGRANAELSAVEGEKMHLCPKNCAPYCEEIPATQPTAPAFASLRLAIRLKR